jgi:hypothetical protein
LSGLGLGLDLIVGAVVGIVIFAVVGFDSWCNQSLSRLRREAVRWRRPRIVLIHVRGSLGLSRRRWFCHKDHARNRRGI